MLLYSSINIDDWLPLWLTMSVAVSYFSEQVRSLDEIGLVIYFLKLFFITHCGMTVSRPIKIPVTGLCKDKWIQGFRKSIMNTNSFNWNLNLACRTNSSKASCIFKRIIQSSNSTRPVTFIS